MDCVNGPPLNKDIYYYDVKDPEFLNWLWSAQAFQSKYAIENGETEYFVYNHDELHRLTELIRIKVFGVKQEYPRAETEAAIKIKQKICQTNVPNESIQINTIHLSTFAYDGDNKAAIDNSKFVASEIPVFVLSLAQSRRCFIDYTGNVYTSASDALITIGQRFRGGIVYPSNFYHKVDSETGKVSLSYDESAGSSLGNRATDVLDSVVTVASVVTGVASLAISLPLGAYFVTARAMFGAHLMYAGVACSALAVAKTSIDLGRYYRTGQHEEAGDKVIFLFAMALSTASQGVSMAARSRIAAGMQAKGVQAMFGGWFKSVFYTLRVSSTLTTFVSITQSIYSLYKKRDWTMGDCYQLSMSFFALYNVVMSPWTIEAIMASEQMRALEQTEFEMKEHKWSELWKELKAEGPRLVCKAAPVLRKVVEIMDRDHFVHQTSDLLQSESEDDHPSEPGLNVATPEIGRMNNRARRRGTKLGQTTTSAMDNMQERNNNEEIRANVSIAEVFETADISTIRIADRNLFANLRAATLRRVERALCRVDRSIVRECIAHCEVDGIREHIRTAYDFVCVVELMNAQNDLSVQQLVGTITTIQSLPIVQMWPSPLYMTYQYYTHRIVIGNEITPQEYVAPDRFRTDNDEFENDLRHEFGISRQAYYGSLREHLINA